MFYKNMYRNVLNQKFDEIMLYKDCFRDEIMHTDYNDYANDMLDDCLVMLRKLNDVYTHDNHIDLNMALKISKWYESVEELLHDFRSHLILCNVNLWERLESYKKAKKHYKL